MEQRIFQRVEEKYLLTKQQHSFLMKKINTHIKKDKYFKTTINNIYFDNDTHDLIINSIEKPIFKEKLRVRSYQTPKLQSKVFLEIKEKYKGIVGKRRMALTLKKLYSYLKTNTLVDDSQIMKEIDYYFKHYKLKPAIYIGYDRISYQGIEDQELRITFDTNLRSRRDNLKLELGDAGKKYFKEDIYIMEIKTLGAIPLWLVKVLSEYKIYPVSFSKYGKIYEKEILNKKEIIC